MDCDQMAIGLPPVTSVNNSVVLFIKNSKKSYIVLTPANNCTAKFGLALLTIKIYLILTI
jgi:hypothetical protein